MEEGYALTVLEDEIERLETNLERLYQIDEKGLLEDDSLIKDMETKTKNLIQCVDLIYREIKSRGGNGDITKR